MTLFRRKMGTGGGGGARGRRASQDYGGQKLQLYDSHPQEEGARAGGGEGGLLAEGARASSSRSPGALLRFEASEVPRDPGTPSPRAFEGVQEVDVSASPTQRLGGERADAGPGGGAPRPCREYDAASLRSATRDWSPGNVLGRGQYGMVYRGQLGGRVVAVKRLEAQGGRREREYRAEVAVLGRARHPHVLRLLGHCPRERALVYEYLPGGSLDEYLGGEGVPQGSEAEAGAGAATGGGLAQSSGAGAGAAAKGAAAEGAPTRAGMPQGSGVGAGAGATADGAARGAGAGKVLRWRERVQVLADVASALQYLHCLTPPIVHRDLKPSNVILDGASRARLGDAGLARVLEKEGDGRTCRVSGTFGYIDPVLLSTWEVVPENDLYALGVVCLQLLMGEPVVHRVHRLVNDSLAAGLGPEAGARERAEAAVLGRLDATAGDWPRDGARQLARLGLRCMSRRQGDRPCLTQEVLPLLQSLLPQSQGADCPP